MKKILLLAIVGVVGVSSARADTKLNVGTDVVKFAKPVTEGQCLAKATARLRAAGFKAVASVEHGAVGTRTDYVVYVDCLQAWGFNGAHVTSASVASRNDQARSLRATVVKALSSE